MEQYHAEMLAVSLAGHDKGKRYVVLGQEKEYFFLVDGTTKLLSRPKKKNQKHVQLIKHLPEEIREALSQIREDADVKKVLISYGSLK